MGLLRSMPGAMRASPEQHGCTESEAADVYGLQVVYCRQCEAWFGLSSIRTLSTHRTSEGLITYFRCTTGHAGYYPPAAGVLDVDPDTMPPGGSSRGQ